MSFWKRIKHALSAFASWLDLSLKPELKRFVYDNRELALKIVMNIGRDYAAMPNETKRAMAMTMIKKELLKSLPSILIKDHYLGLLIEIVVAILKSQGKL